MRHILQWSGIALKRLDVPSSFKKGFELLWL